MIKAVGKKSDEQYRNMTIVQNIQVEIKGI